MRDIISNKKQTKIPKANIIYLQNCPKMLVCNTCCMSTSDNKYEKYPEKY